MGKVTTKQTENIYFRCRKEAATCNPDLSSRESTADLLGVSPSSLADYELGKTKVIPVDKVVLMADLYNAPQLMNCYCAAECPIGCRRKIATEIKPLNEMVISLLDLVADRKLDRHMETLTHIAAQHCENCDEEMSDVIGYLDRLRMLVDGLTLYDEKRRGATHDCGRYDSDPCRRVRNPF